MKKKKSSILKTHENCEGSNSSTWKIGNSKKPSRTRVRSWNYQWLLLCRLKLWKIVGVMDRTQWKQNLHVFWKLMNLWKCVWETRYSKITKAILQDKVKIYYSTTILFFKFIFCFKLWGSWSKSSGGQGMEKIEKKKFGVELDNSKKEVIDEVRTKDARLHFVWLMNMSLEKKLNWRQSTKNTMVELHSEVTL